LQTPIRVHGDPPARTAAQTDPHVRDRQRPARWLTVALAGLLAGALDLTFAFVFYGIRVGVDPASILRGIASGVLGPDAMQMGSWVVALGALLHFGIAVCAAFVFYAASFAIAILTRRPLLSGAAFGVAMYLAMHFIVIPLSRIPFHLPKLPSVIGELCSHVFLFGMVIALGVARARRPQAAPSA
jgi:uncharacterized membrane protein YagU involved in acid resistance